MNGRLREKTVLITGGGQGIGRAAALAFAEEGARIAICGRNPENLGAVAAELRALGAKVVAESCDVTNEGQVSDFVAAVLKEFDAIDVLVNNAGILGPRGELAKVTAAEWQATIQANLTGPFLVAREVLRASMLKRGRGVVINVSSGQGRRATAGWGPYAASKFGLEGMTQVWADETRGTGIRFYTLSPGPTATAMRAAAAPGEDPRTIKSPAVAAQAFVALALDDCALPTGGVLRLDPAGKILC
ncbi:MAG: SDR family NAD(P)-dependent oxidoreductase [Elusimicrobia bacterium]|nr:SDR family NAD(P)-dependent oxidoreductase [Elusimicrobiota bacterium]